MIMKRKNKMPKQSCVMQNFNVFRNNVQRVILNSFQDPLEYTLPPVRKKKRR